MIKNQAGQVVQCGLINNADGSDYAGAANTVSVFVKGQGGTQAVGGGVVTAIGNGLYEYAPTQAETNYNAVAFSFKAAGVGTQHCLFEPIDNAVQFAAALPESYAADGAPATVAQLLYALWASQAQFDITGTARTLKRLDGVTPAMVLRFDQVNATSSTRES